MRIDDFKEKLRNQIRSRMGLPLIHRMDRQTCVNRLDQATQQYDGLILMFYDLVVQLHGATLLLFKEK